MKTILWLLILAGLFGCSDSGQTNSQTAEEMIERYNKPIDAAGAAADQVQQIRDQQSGK
jgi:hypothetical protein